MATCLISVRAQQNVTAASLSGTVQDANGSSIPGAAIIVTNTATNQAQRATTDASGRFRLAYLRAGDYSIRAEKDGFDSIVQHFTAAIGQGISPVITMTVKGVSADVDILPDPPIVDTAQTHLAGNVTPKEIRDLPLNGRNFIDLALMLPGVSRTNTGNIQRFAETSAVPGTGISVAGQRNLNNSFIVDGSSANDDSVELAGTFYSEEVIREFQVITNGAGAEYGRASGGFISIITQSGTNKFRGGVYSFLRNQRFDARNPLAPEKDPLTQVEYGATLGGPIKHDRTFFFTNFEQTRRNDSNVITIAPVNVDSINARLDAVHFTGPRIGTGLMPGGYDTSSYFARVDHKLTGSTDLAVTYNLYDINAVNARTVGGLNAVSRGTDLQNTDHTANIQLVTAFDPKTVNELRAQYRRSRLEAPPFDLAGPAVNINGVANLGTATSSPTRRDIDLFQVSDAVTHIFDRHLVKTGGEFIYNDLDIEFPGALQGVYTFNSLSSFLSGNYSQYQQAFGAASQRQRNPNAGAFAQDEWQPGRGLTVNLGVRYDLQFLPEPIRTDKNNISPRVGFAWSPNPKTVIRGSAGIYYDRIPTRATSNALQRDGTRYFVAQLTPGMAGAPVFPNVLTAAPSVLLIKPSISAIDPNIENSSTEQASLEIERQIGTKMSASLGYMHVRGRHLILARNANVPRCTSAVDPNLCRPDPRFGNITRYEGSGDSWYDGMFVNFERRANRWLSMRASYTLSKSLDDAGNFFFSTPQNNLNLRDDKGLSDNDQRHRVTASGSFVVPRNARGGAFRRFASGFELSGIFTYASPLPFNVVTGSDRNGDTNNNDRPAGVGRNTGRGFDYAALDLRVTRRFRISERVGFQVIAEAFNLLNRANFAVPNNVFGTGFTPLPSFGRPTAALDPRQAQFGLKLEF